MNTASQVISNEQQAHLNQRLRNDKVERVMSITGCTKGQAITELVAEEWNQSYAVMNIRQAQAQGDI